LKLSTSYKQILAISLPIMLGSAAQNLIVLTDNVFLYHKGSLEFAAIGLIGVFYLAISTIGYGISKGGQIIIARRYGENQYKEVGKSFYAMVGLELGVALILFLLIQLFSPSFFKLFIASPAIIEQCLSYLYPRSYGIFFSYIGLAFIALYTGLAKTKFIIYDTLLLASVNLVLNYVLIFGKYGAPELGIVGAAWASTIAEILAFIAFVIYMMFDRANRQFGIFTIPKFDLVLVKQVWKISSPIIVQSVVGIGSWFLFFSWIENESQRDLEISNLIRNVYLMLSIPCWGFASSINTIVSNFIGNGRFNAVLPMVNKTTKINVGFTLLIAMPVILLPEVFLYPIFGRQDMSLINDAGNLFWILIGILVSFCIGATYFNGLSGTGDTLKALKLQVLCSVVYIGFAFLFIKILPYSLERAWSVEIIYWALLFILSLLSIKSDSWKSLRI